MTDQQRAQLTAYQLFPLPQGQQLYIDQWRSQGEAQVLPALPGHLRIAALSARCRQTAVARQFMAWLCGDEARRALASASSGIGVIRAQPPEAAAADESAMVVIDPVQQRYEQMVVARLANSQSRPTLRIPAAAEYRAALDAAIQQALAGELSAEQALGQAAQQWEQITERQGRQQQLRAWRKSQGLLGR